MSVAEHDFLKQLDQSLGNYPNKQEILMEYETHVHEISLEIGKQDDSVKYKQIEQRLGSPEEIAKVWSQEVSITPKRTQWLFVGFNVCLFIGGAVLTFLYNYFNWSWVEIIWVNMTDIPNLIIMVYFVFWGLLGYEIGKEFGSQGKRFLRKTFFISIIPNLVLMNLTVFQLIPTSWFQPLLSIPFILACIVCTAFLYPVCLLGYRWGKKLSV
ncbi:HAAS signaling domain-containing protein [Aquibacillus sediminis]|uniref:HAAS signaling domain-containing protein n=1 Tax=Aquibacillus sediminis TaxID=2574734 RepID=UPI00110880EF|nr:DUF1700 domain-containing protein [Aquibacillus sediminis]